MNSHNLFPGLPSSSSNPYPEPRMQHNSYPSHALQPPHLSLPVPPQWPSQQSIMSPNQLLPPTSHQRLQYQNHPSWQQQQLPPIHQQQHQHQQLQERHYQQQQQQQQQQHHAQLQQHHQAQLSHQHPQQQQGYSNGIAYIPSHIIHDAMRANSVLPPVGSSSTDEVILVRALHEATRAGRTYKQALDDLHNVNNHSAFSWKDYYLEHRIRIDGLVDQYANGRTTKKPGMYSNGSRRDTDTPVSPPPQKRRTATPVKGSQKSQSQGQPLTNRRHTINSLTAPAPVYNARLPPPNSEVQIPDPPSRSPTPPTKVIVKAGKNSYTTEDKEYFIKFISWELKRDPNQTRMQLCEKLAVKVPSHTAASWTYHWTRNHDVADKILGAAQGVDYDAEPSSSSESEAPARVNVRARVRYKDASSSISGSESDSESNHADSGSDYDHDVEEQPTSADEKEMGEAGGAFTEADYRIAAKHVASHPDWDNLTAHDRWGPFHDRYPGRSAKSWAEYYRRNSAKIDRLARAYAKKRKTKAEKPPASPQPSRTSWTGKKETSPVAGASNPPNKRKFSAGTEEDQDDRRKHGRGGEDT